MLRAIPVGVKSRAALLAVVTLAAGVAVTCCWRRHATVRRASGPVPQQAYVWQREWTQAVRSAVADAGPHLAGVLVLGAEIDFGGGEGRCTRVDLPYTPSLRTSGGPVGLALRIGPFGGPFDTSGAAAHLVLETATSLVREATAHGVAVAELQVDFDCATSKLAGYRLWIEAVRRRVAPVPVTFTALPAWLESRAFVDLAAAADGYVLQVHSLERPRGPDAPFTLCDPAAARRAVERAARLGRPFRVALPTYGYLVAFDPSGAFVGLSAEGPALSWPQDARVEAVRADPVTMADLVRGWVADRPASLRGIVWYRLPNDEDRLNWRVRTLLTVMEGRPPASRLRAVARRVEPMLSEVDLLNDGDADAPLTCGVTASSSGGARVTAADGLAGFRRSEERDGAGGVDAGAGEVTLVPSPPLALERLAPGERRTIGWLRLSEDKEVRADVTLTLAPP